MTITVNASRSRKQITYADHWHTANSLETLGNENSKGSYHQFLGSIVFRAFALEAFLNHVGEELFASWRDLERLSPKGKLNVIAEKVGLVPNYGAMPWQIEPKLTAIRNKIAHGKNELLEDERVLMADDYDREMLSMLQADWQAFATSENSAFTRNQLSALMAMIWMASGHELSSLFANGIQLNSASLLNKDAS